MIADGRTGAVISRQLSRRTATWIAAWVPALALAVPSSSSGGKPYRRRALIIPRPGGRNAGRQTNRLAIERPAGRDIRSVDASSIWVASDATARTWLRVNGFRSRRGSVISSAARDTSSWMQGDNLAPRSDGAANDHSVALLSKMTRPGPEPAACRSASCHRRKCWKVRQRRRIKPAGPEIVVQGHCPGTKVRQDVRFLAGSGSFSAGRSGSCSGWWPAPRFHPRQERP